MAGHSAARSDPWKVAAKAARMDQKLVVSKDVHSAAWMVQ